MEDVINNKQSYIDLNGYQPLNDITINNLFEACDIDKDGFVSKSELKHFLRTLRNNTNISQKKLERLYNKADRNNDDMIDKNEFELMMKDPLFHRYLKGYCDVFLPVGFRESEYTYTPYGIITISLIQLIMHIADVSLSDKHDDVLCLNMALDPNKKNEVWRYFTYMFIHDSWGHLITNLVLQIFLGAVLEIYHRSWRVALIYISGGFAGSLATGLIQPTVRLIGASGGVYAIIASYLSTVILNFTEMERPVLQLIFFTIFIVVDCGQSLYHTLYSNNYRTGFASHIFGGLAGLLAGLFILRNFKKRRYEILIQKIAIVSYTILMITMIFFTVLS